MNGSPMQDLHPNDGMEQAHSPEMDLADAPDMDQAHAPETERPPSPIIGSAVRLEKALRDHGHRFLVEARSGLAVLTCDATGAAAIDPQLRRWLVQAAQGAGFTHVAFEIRADTSPPSRETLPGHQSH